MIRRGFHRPKAHIGGMRLATASARCLSLARRCLVRTSSCTPSRRPRRGRSRRRTRRPDLLIGLIDRLGRVHSLVCSLRRRSLPPSVQGFIPLAEAVVASSPAPYISGFPFVLPPAAHVVDGVSAVPTRRVFHAPLQTQPKRTQFIQEFGTTHLRMLLERTLGELDHRVPPTKLAHE